MESEKQILLSYSAFNAIDRLLTSLDLSTLNRTEEINDYILISEEISEKKEKLQRREAYTKLVHAKGEKERHSAQRDYHWQSKFL